MIIIQLSGGLGNQMFQYALGKHLSFIHKTELKLDISFYEKHDLRAFELNVFKIEDGIISKDELNQLLPSSSGNLIKRVLNKIQKEIHGYEFFSEEKLDFSPEILMSPSKSILFGYWQSEKYFKDITPLIKTSFQFKNKPDEINSVFMNQMQNSNSVSIHIRRGDYVNNPLTNKIHGSCGIRYYKEAINHMVNKLNSPVFYFFSDDMDWVKENMRIDYDHFFIDHNKEKSYEDMRLISQCKHNIIANSSFSWWGAWLNDNPDKIVIAPEKWFNDQTRNSKDLIPESWLKLAN